jgi:hypothetical protein
MAAIPFAVVSSAVAIPSAGKGLAEHAREFVVVRVVALRTSWAWLVFYAGLSPRARSRDSAAVDLIAAGAVALVALRAGRRSRFLLQQPDRRPRALPCQLLAGLVGSSTRSGKGGCTLSTLIVVLVCGLIINNPHLVTWHAKLRGMQNETYEQTLREFKGLVAELTFAMKSFFFLLLGYWTDVRSMLSIEAVLIAIAGIAAILQHAG